MSDHSTVTVERDGVEVSLTLDPRHFSIDPSILDRHLCEAGQNMLQYGQLEAELRTEVARKEALIDSAYASLDLDIRQRAKQGGTKVTENQIKNEILANQTYQGGLDNLRESQRNHNVMRWAMNALNKRTDCLIAMAYRERALIKAGEY